MPRPRKCRRIGHSPAALVYKPQGLPGGLLKGVVLPLDGLEAMRLVDALGLDQETAAAQMGVSRPTLGRMLAQARQLVARALTSGWAIRIEGGEPDLAGEGATPPPCEMESRLESDAPPCRRRRCCRKEMAAEAAKELES